MSSVPRPLIAVLVVTALVFALWTVALKHTLLGSGGKNGASGSPGAYQSAINQARGLQSVINKAGAKAGGTPVQSQGNPQDTTPSTPAHPGSQQTATTTTSTTTTTVPKAPQSKHHPGTGTSTIASAAATSHPVASVPPAPAPRLQGIALVAEALREHKVVALLFYNPAAADDRQVQTEMSSIPTQGGEVVKLSVPVGQLGTYATLLNQVPINFSPTLVLINRDHQASEIAGFADSFEIVQRVAQALGSPAPTR